MDIVRRCCLPIIGAVLLALAACTPASEKADAHEAQYDRLMGLGAFPAALGHIQTAVSLDDSKARRYIKLAEVQLALGRPAAAASSYQKALDLEPDNIGALQNLSILAVRGGQYDAARQYISPLLALSANDPAGLLASGAMAIGERRYKDAIKFADQIETAMPDRPDGYVLKARALDALGRSREAVEVMQQRLAIVGDDKDLLNQLMVSYRKLGDVKGVRSTAIKLMPLVPDDPRYALEAARAFQAQGQRDDVERVIEDLKKRFATNADVLVAVGNFWRDTLPLADAKTRIAELAAASPPRQRTVIADQLIDLGAINEALGLLRPLAPAAVDGRNMDAQTHYARALFLIGDLDGARKKVDAALARDSGNPEALLLRARLRLKAGDYRGAFTDAQLVANDDETNEEAALLVPEIYSAQGNQMLAAGAFGNARQDFPDSVAVVKAETDWLLRQERNNEAAQRAISFANAHRQNGQAANLANSICRKTHAPVCSVQLPSIVKTLG